MSVIRNSLTHEFHAKVDLSVDEDGVRCEIAMPLNLVTVSGGP